MLSEYRSCGEEEEEGDEEGDEEGGASIHVSLQWNSRHLILISGCKNVSNLSKPRLKHSAFSYLI
jgi:hypothetical protein